MAEALIPAEALEGYQQDLMAGRRLPAAIASGVVAFVRRRPLGALGLAIVLVFLAAAALAPVATPYSYTEQNVRHRLEHPSLDHPMGTDSLGRDTLSRIMWGARVSLFIGVGATVIGTAITASMGIVSGYYGGWFDKIFQRFVDIWLALPGLVLLLTLIAIFGRGLWQMVLVLSIVGGAASVRVFRSQVISLRFSPFIEAARAVGASDTRVMAHHILPNVMYLIILSATGRVAGVILAESSLSFLGFGLPPPHPSWGRMLSEQGRQYLRIAPELAIFPGLMLTLTLYGFTLFGDSLRDILDPRLRGRR